MLYAALIVIAVASRFLPHPPNVACLGAIGLFAGCYVTGKRAYTVPVITLLASDLIGTMFNVRGLGFYNPVAMLGVYLGATLAVPVGRVLSRFRSNVLSQSWGKTKYGATMLGGSLATSLVFFLISNFGVWAAGWYPATAAGLVNCFVMAIPFFGFTVLGDLVFSTVLFGGYEATRLAPSLVATPAIGDSATTSAH